VLNLSWVYAELAPYYSAIGRPSIDPVLMFRMLIIGYVFTIRSERQICREVQFNLAYRWFRNLGLEDAIPDHSAFSRARNERFRESDILRRVFERIVETCIESGLVGGEGFAVDASLIEADTNRQRSIPGVEWKKQIDPTAASRRPTRLCNARKRSFVGRERSRDMYCLALSLRRRAPGRLGSEL
jgi:transposase